MAYNDIQIRTKSGRGGVNTDSSINLVLRLYLWIPDFLLDSFNESLDPSKNKIICMAIYLLHTAYFLVAGGNSEIKPLRIMLYYNKDDGFCSILVGYKVTPAQKRLGTISQVRFVLFQELFKVVLLGLPMFPLSLINVNTHERQGDWDSDHALEAPEYQHYDKIAASIFDTCMTHGKYILDALNSKEIEGVKDIQVKGTFKDGLDAYVAKQAGLAQVDSKLGLPSNSARSQKRRQEIEIEAERRALEKLAILQKELEAQMAAQARAKAAEAKALEGQETPEEGGQ